ncbi:MAG TPA: PVC-type heme-binding CxxCH protein, partial [Gemmataceae bacterium]
NYPYPYVIGGLCWQFPCVVPSDWEAQHLHQPNNPVTVRDWQAALDAVVAKKGVFDLVFHPHGWIKAEQVIDLIDHAEAKHGRKVKFLTFREARDRLVKHLLGGVPLRDPETGKDNGVRLLDLNADGFLDVVIGNGAVRRTRLWVPESQSWVEGDFPVRIGPGTRFGVLTADGHASLIDRNGGKLAAWRFDGRKWVETPEQVNGLKLDGDFLLRDLDGDGVCEAITGGEHGSAVFRLGTGRAWRKLAFALPEGARVAGAESRDAGLRFVDLDEDGHDDVIFSDEKRYGVYLFESMEKGWSRKVLSGKRGDKGELPAIARNGADNGFFVHSRALWWQNEDTGGLLKDHVDRRPFDEMLADVQPGPKSPRQSLKLMQARPGFEVELVAAEPLVQDPVAFAWGPDGKLWVVEMGDYPLGVDDKGTVGGRVRFLEDTDGDGRYDRSTVFLDRLGYPTGVAPWRKGVLVTCAPDIFYAEDTDGDGKADVRKVLFTGFTEGNQQHRVNTLAWGLDNWLY